MNKFKISIYCLLVFLLGVVACSVESPRQVAPDQAGREPVFSDDVVNGELLVRFDARVSDILERHGLTKSAAGGPMTRSGVLSVDEILDLVEGYEIERVFPVDRRNEDKTRDAGLHLWYVVRFSEEHSVAEVAADLAKLGEVSRVDFNRTLKRASDSKPIPLTREMIDDMVSRSDDPLYGYQWYLKNDPSLNDYLPVLGADGEQKKDAEGNLLYSQKFVSGADIKAEQAWEKCTGHPEIIVAILDEGVDVTHPDLEKSMWCNEGETYGSVEDGDENGYAGDYHGYNFVKKNGKITVNDRYDSGHGTHVAGTIAARNNNGEGIKSIAGGNGADDSGVRIMSCQIFSGQYVGTVLDEVRAIKYAADNGAVILQCSWGYISGAANPYDWTPQFTDDEQWELYNPLEKQALDYFVRTAGSPDGVIDGGIAVFAAGNESAPAASYPAAYKDYVSVASIAGDFTPATYSNYGPGTTIVAPGGDQDYYFEFGSGKNMGAVGCVLSTLPLWHTSEDIEGLGEDFTGYGYFEGTSMACPQVSGVIALGLSYALEQKKHFKAKDFIKLVYDSATGLDNYLDGDKLWYKYVIDLGKNQPSLMDLGSYKNKMGHGLIDAGALLAAIDGSDAPKMTFPNVTVAAGAVRKIDMSLYLDIFTEPVLTVADPDIFGYVIEGKMLILTGKSCGQTSVEISCGAQKQKFVVTVRSGAYSGDGWL